MKLFRRSVLLRILMTVISVSLFCCLFAVLETVRQLNCDHVLRDSEVNNHLSGFPSIASQNNPRLQSDELYKDQGRALKSLSRWRIWEEHPPKYNRTPEAKQSAFGQYLSCSDIKAIEVLGNIGRGYTKTVQKGLYKGTEVALKSVQLDNEDIRQCVKGTMANTSVDKCFILAKYKLAKEIIMLQQLQHANIVKVRDLAIRIITLVFNQAINQISCFVDPFNWIIILANVYICLRSFRLTMSL